MSAGTGGESGAASEGAAPLHAELNPHELLDLPPVVSVIIPTYNRMPLLAEAVESVRAQTWTNWELIVVDDGSTDGTAAYLDGLGDARVRAVRTGHTGSSTRARIAGVAAARGEWLAFLDSDDLWHREKLAVQLAAVGARDDCPWSYTGVDVVHLDGSPHQGAQLPARSPSGWILAELLDFEAAASIQTLMIRRDALEAVGGFDPEFTLRGDYDLALRLAARYPVCGVDRRLTRVREHPGRTTTLHGTAEQLRYNEAAFRKAEAAATREKIRRRCRRQRAVQLARLARVLSAQGEQGEAVRTARAALAIGSGSPEPIIALAAALWGWMRRRGS